MSNYYNMGFAFKTPIKMRLLPGDISDVRPETPDLARLDSHVTSPPPVDPLEIRKCADVDGEQRGEGGGRVLPPLGRQTTGILRLEWRVSREYKKAQLY